jgi:hypothetical protein
VCIFAPFDAISRTWSAAAAITDFHAMAALNPSNEAFNADKHHKFSVTFRHAGKPLLAMARLCVLLLLLTA